MVLHNHTNIDSPQTGTMWFCFWRLNVRNILHGVLEGKTKTLGILDKLLLVCHLNQRVSDYHSYSLTYVGTSFHLLPPIGKPVVHFERSDSFKLWQFASWNNMYTRNSIGIQCIEWGRGTFATKMACLWLVLRRLRYWLQSLTRFLNDSITGIGNFFSFGLIRILILYKETMRTSKVNQNKTWDIMIIVQPIENSNGFRTLTNKIGYFLHNNDIKWKNACEWRKCSTFIGTLSPYLTMKLKWQHCAITKFRIPMVNQKPCLDGWLLFFFFFYINW